MEIETIKVNFQFSHYWRSINWFWKCFINVCILVTAQNRSIKEVGSVELYAFFLIAPFSYTLIAINTGKRRSCSCCFKKKGRIILSKLKLDPKCFKMIGDKRFHIYFPRICKTYKGFFEWCCTFWNFDFCWYPS